MSAVFHEQSGKSWFFRMFERPLHLKRLRHRIVLPGRKRNRNEKGHVFKQPSRPALVGSCMIDDQDIPLSYIFYVIAVIAIMGSLMIGGFLLWAR
jgi:hypothetical protein